MLGRDHPLVALSKRYPQLVLPIREGMSSSEEYKDICLRMKHTDRTPEFNGTSEDRFESVSTPAGDVDILYLADREDFIHAYLALGYHCEPARIPKSTGAVTITGINNVEKAAALSIPIVLADTSLYRDTIVLLCRGPYSNVRGEVFGIDEDRWMDMSFTIRKYHELTHVVSRRLYIENKDPVRDEVLADMMGIIAIKGEYDRQMARTFLGIEKDGYREGGRLQNYTEDITLGDAITAAGRLIECFYANIKPEMIKEPFGILKLFEESKLGIDGKYEI